MIDKAKNSGICAVCGRSFTEKQRVPFVRNLNLWGGGRCHLSPMRCPARSAV